MTLKPGEAVVPFSLPGVDGAEHGPQEGAISAVVFWCNHCPYVQAWQDRLNAFARANEDVHVVAVCSNDAGQQPEDSFEAMTERARERDYAFAYVQDESQEVARAYGAERTPEVFLFDSGGRLVYHGAIDDSWEDADDATVSYLDTAVDAIRRGDLCDPAETAAVGCSIKFR